MILKFKKAKDLTRSINAMKSNSLFDNAKGSVITVDGMYTLIVRITA